MRFTDWRRRAIVASIVWAIAGAYAGVHLAVSPVISAYATCLQNHHTDSSDCRRNLHRDWALYSGNRLTYAASIGLGPLPMAWLIAYGLNPLPQRRRTVARQTNRALQEHPQARAA